MSTMFHDRPDAERMAIRAAIEDLGGEVSGYSGTGIQAALPRRWTPIEHALRPFGLTMDEASLHLFPLGSDAPPEHLRHDGRYPGSKGYWLYATFQPKGEPCCP